MLTLSNQQKVTLEKIIPQLFILGFDDQNCPAQAKLGGYLAFDRNPLKAMQPKNIINPQQIQQLNQKISDSSPLAWRAIDCEGGLDWLTNTHGNRIRQGVNRLNPNLGFEPTLCAQQISDLVKQGKFQQAEQACNDIATLIKTSGFNLSFAPVVDLALTEESTIIYQMKRSFGETPELVIQCAELFIKACKQQDIQTALKHYPGHGSATNDSHLGITDITTCFDQRELEPYAALANPCGMVMSAHLLHRDIDDKPASISKIWLDKLRHDYHFTGVIISDDLQMDGLQNFIKQFYPDEISKLTDPQQTSFLLAQSIIHALNAGNDMLIIGNQLQYQPNLAQFCFDTVMNAVIQEKNNN